jgi:hypothetical protein
LMRLHANNTLDTQVHAAISSIYFLRRVTSDKPEVLGLAATPCKPSRRLYSLY